MGKGLSCSVLLCLACVLSCFALVLKSTASNDGASSSQDVLSEDPDAPSGAWERRLDGSGKGPDEAKAMAVDRSGNVYVTGQSKSEKGSFDCTAVKYCQIAQEISLCRASLFMLFRYRG